MRNDRRNAAVFERGDDWDDIARELDEALEADRPLRTETVAIRLKDQVWRNACTAAAWVAGDYDWSAPIARKARDELAAFARTLLHAPEDAPATLTTGGTESVFLAVKAARDWAREARPRITAPVLLMGRSAHPCLSKAAQNLGVREVRVPLTSDHRTDPAALRQAVTPDAIMVVASLPSDSRGMCDDVPAIAAVARDHGLWCHVDACLGGFLVPYLKRLGHALPDFDFRVPGVRSISLDQHKYAYAPTGISTLVLRDSTDLAHQRFAFSDWDGPAKSYDYFAGTRPIEATVAAWATMRQIGDDGYLERARLVQSNTEHLFAEIAKLPAWRC
ncbi:MAG: aspartate aminotransferase family protein [Alphaproteobacteria bacterium]